MSCCSERTATLATKKPGSTQHVNYAKGMVLGVDDFTQEFAYLTGRAEWLARDLVGYGTAAGLAVALEDDGANGPRIRVTSGSALSPRGTLICVPADQCASLNAWLAKPGNLKAVTARVGHPPAITLYLTLCYADCETGLVPIPGEPCRSEDELMAPSRIADDFRLQLALDRPWQREEDALRDFVRWLRAVQVDDIGSPPSAGEGDVEKALYEAARPWFELLKAPQGANATTVSPPLSDYLFGLPPATLRIHPGDRCEFLRAAFRFWVTELRPLWMARCCSCGGIEQPADDCVLLAELNVPLVGTPASPGTLWQVDGQAQDVHVDQRDRPFLVHQRLLQEWLACGSCCDGSTAGASGGPVGGPPAEPPRPIVGTDRQVIVTESPAAITLSTPQDIATVSKPTFDGLITTASVEIKVNVFNTDADLDDTMHCVILRPPNPLRGSPPRLKARLPVSSGKEGRVYIVKSPNTSIEVVPNGTDMIEEAQASLIIEKGKSATLVSTGKSGWFVIATT